MPQHFEIPRWKNENGKIADITSTSRARNGRRVRFEYVKSDFFCAVRPCHWNLFYFQLLTSIAQIIGIVKQKLQPYKIIQARKRKTGARKRRNIVGKGLTY